MYKLCFLTGLKTLFKPKNRIYAFLLLALSDVFKQLFTIQR